MYLCPQTYKKDYGKLKDVLHRQLKTFADKAQFTFGQLKYLLVLYSAYITTVSVFEDL